MNFWARRAFVIYEWHDSLIPPGDGQIIRRAFMSTNRSMGTSVIHWERRTHHVIFGPSYVKLVSRRTARHATIWHVDGLFNGTYSEREVLTVEITAAGVLNMRLIILLIFNTMNTVATKLDKKLECGDERRFLSSVIFQWNTHARKYKENEAIGKNHMSEAPSILQIAGGGRCYSNELVYVQQKNNKVKAHRVNEDCRKKSVGPHVPTPYSRNPNGFRLNNYEEHNQFVRVKVQFSRKRRTLQDNYGPMSENNKHKAANDVAVLWPDCHAEITGVRLYRDSLGSMTHVRIDKLMLGKPRAAPPAS